MEMLKGYKDLQIMLNKMSSVVYNLFYFRILWKCLKVINICKIMLNKMSRILWKSFKNI
jgi:hypothetical protein